MLQTKFSSSLCFFTPKTYTTSAFIICGGTEAIREFACCHIIRQHSQKRWMAHNDWKGTLILIITNHPTFGPLTSEQMENMARYKGVTLDLNQPRFLPLYINHNDASCLHFNKKKTTTDQQPAESDHTTFQIEPNLALRHR